jgi:hypothetical protein
VLQALTFEPTGAIVAAPRRRCRRAQLGLSLHLAEPVPDAFVRASEITLVGSPSALRHRLAQGLVFPKNG